MKFIRKSENYIIITLRGKILRPRKKWNMNKNIFSKIERPGFGGGGEQFAAFCKNDVKFENIFYYSEKNEFFRISYFKYIH